MMDTQQLMQALRNADQAVQNAQTPEEAEEHRRAAQRLAQMLQQAQQQAPQQQPQQPAPQEQSLGSKLLNAAQGAGQGAFFGFADELSGGLMAGLNSLAGLFGRGTGESFGDAYTGIRDAARSNLQTARQENPVLTTGSEIGGGLLTGVAGLAKQGVKTAARTIPRIMAQGATTGTIYGTGASEGETVKDVALDALQGGTSGAATAGLLGKLGGATQNARQRLAEKAAEKLRYRKAVKLLQNKGVTGLSTGQATGNKAVKTWEATQSGSLLGGSLDRQLKTLNNKLNRTLMKEAGFDQADLKGNAFLSADAIERARAKFSARYDNLYKGKRVKFDNKFFEDIGDVQRFNKQNLIETELRGVEPLIQQLMQKSKNPLTGEAYQAYRTLLNDRLRDAPAYLKRTLVGMKKAVDGAAGRSLKRADKTASNFRKNIDQDYARFKELEKAFLGSAQADLGVLPIPSLRRSVMKNPAINKEFKDLVSAANTVVLDVVNNSGTATRNANYTTVIAPFLEAVTTGGIPLTSLTGITATLAGNKLLAKGVGAGAKAQGLLRAGAAAKQGLVPAGLLAAPLSSQVYPRLLQNEELGLLRN